LLEWDEETTLPEGGRDERGEQLATLEAARHGLLTSDHLGDLIEEVALAHEGDERWRREIELLRDLRASDLALPADLVRAYAAARARATAAWEDARDADDFKLLAPALGDLVALARETAATIDADADPYDIFLDEYEPSLTRAQLEPVLADLRKRLVPLVSDVGKKTASWPDKITRAVPDTKLWDVCNQVLKSIGFDFTRGHLDRATHPGTTALGFDDIRLSLRPNHDDLLEAVLTTLHEGGHGLYDQGLAPQDRATLLAQAPSMSMHEAQARLWENHVGRSQAFWTFLFPKLRDSLGPLMQGLDAEKFYQASSRVRPSLIRATADELSYHLHVLLRYELEAAMLSGDLKVADLTNAWNERSMALLGVKPTSDLTGVLQDGHWAAGMFGYFPTYTLGSLYAAQLAEAYAKTAKLDEQVARGEFTPLRTWLRDNIYASGDRLPTDRLVTRVTGKGLDVEAYFRHIKHKFD
jgi:carboxypeptidase Taq